MFHIIVQISKFLKEFSDFERCPTFRHPQIKGPEKMLSDIGLLKEIKELGLYQSQTKAKSTRNKKSCPRWRRSTRTSRPTARWSSTTTRRR